MFIFLFFYLAIDISTFEALKKFYKTNHCQSEIGGGSDDGGGGGVITTLICGAISGGLGATVVYPLLVVFLSLFIYLFIFFYKK